jgi:hypothetical protein
MNAEQHPALITGHGARATVPPRGPARRRWVPWPWRVVGAAAAVAIAPAAAVAGGGRSAGRAARPLAPPGLAACVHPGALPCHAQDRLHEAYGTGALQARGMTGAATTIAVAMPHASPWVRAGLAVYSRFRLARRTTPRLPPGSTPVPVRASPPAARPGTGSVDARAASGAGTRAS